MRKRVFWLGLSAVLGLILLFGAVSLKPAIDRHIRRQTVIDAITRRGGDVITEPGPFDSIVGTHFGNATAFFVSRGPGADLDLAGLTEFPEVKRLAAQKSAISDAGLAFAEPLKQLELVNFTGTAIGDRGLAHLRECRDIAYMELNGTLITDDGLIFLKGLPKLARLHLDGTNITDAGLEHLISIRTLRHVDLSRTKVSPEGLCILKKLPALQVLTIEGMNFTSDEYDTVHAALPKVIVNK